MQHLKTYASLSGIDEVFEVGLNRAVTLIAEKRAGRAGAGRGAAAQPLKDLGVHPVSGEPMLVMPGRFGPYVKCGKVNANVPKGSDPAALTPEAAAALIDARTDAAPKPARGKAAAKAKPAVAKKPAAKKAASKPKAKAPARAKVKAAS